MKLKTIYKKIVCLIKGHCLTTITTTDDLIAPGKYLGYPTCSRCGKMKNEKIELELRHLDHY